MLDLRELKYFIVSADTGSFSAAAAVLYTTQSNVSKTIAALETRIGYQLLRRVARGVELTARGDIFYQKANELLQRAEALETESGREAVGTIRISSNPGSWFAERFSEFYELHEAENLHFHIHFDNTDRIIRRLGDAVDDLGFIYVFPDRMESFQYELKRLHLSFECLRKVDGMLYDKPEWRKKEESGKDRQLLAAEDPGKRGQRLVQMSRDEFTAHRNWYQENEGNISTAVPEIAVTTNSDYIMNIMLEKNHLANLSAESFAAQQTQTPPGKRLHLAEGKILYGVLKNQNSRLSNTAVEFEHYIKQRVIENDSEGYL